MGLKTRYGWSPHLNAWTGVVYEENGSGKPYVIRAIGKRQHREEIEMWAQYMLRRKPWLAHHEVEIDFPKLD